MNHISYLRGDASKPTTPGPKIIAHVVNDQGAWGAGFTRSLNKQWPYAQEEYKSWHKYRSHYTGSEGFTIGNTHHTLVASDKHPEGPLWVVHMMAQQGLIGQHNPRPLRYDALGSCLLRLGKFAKMTTSTIHMPRIGCGLAGGNWVIVEQLINDALTRQGVATYVYDLEN